MVPAAGTEAEAWDALSVALALKGVTAGRRWSAPADVPSLGGTIEYAGQSPYRALLRLDRPGPGAVDLSAVDCGGAVMVTLGFYLYGARAAGVVSSQQPLWQAWIEKQFPAVPDASSRPVE
jgi:hypothetical protein